MDYNEVLCQAIDVIVFERISGLEEKITNLEIEIKKLKENQEKKEVNK